MQSDRGWALVAVGMALALVGGCPADEPSPPADVWDGTFDESVARPEHPRPDFRRDSFINLNTTWQFAFDPDDAGLDGLWFERDDVWDERIQVPYAWEAPLSGLGVLPDAYSPAYTAEANTYRGVAWYRLELPGPLQGGEDWHLVFGAVDFAATVWIDGSEVGSHSGGYGPFSVNLSAATDGARAPVISVRVEDWTDADDRAQPVGKQGGAWYTRVSGIWQTVYLEQRPPVHLTGVRIVPDLAAGAVEVTPAFDGSAAVTLTAKLDGDVVGEASADGAASTISLPLDVVSPWDVDHPTLYDLDVSVTDGGRTDVVHSYFGLSRPATDWIPGRSPDDTEDPAEQGRAFTFNGEPIYPRCVLDQSYWPDGLYTAPSLDDIRADLEAARAFGFNCIRLHIKPDEPVKLRLIDELGFYLVYDAPCLDMQAENGPGFVGREHFAADLDALVERDAGHPSLLLWVVFNENWGLSADGSLISPTPLADDPEMQGWVRQMVDRARDLDPARPVEDNSAGGVVGVFEHLSTDSNSFHNYDDDPSGWREFLADQDAATYPGSTANYVGGEVQDGAVWWNSEFASFSFLGSADEAFCDLFGALNELRRVPRLAGWVLTQLTDVEFEDNGLLTYDREAKDDLCERHGVALGDLLGDDFVGFDWLPGEALSSGEEVAVPLWFSQWSTGGATSRTLTLRWGDGQGTSFPFTPQPWTVTAIGGVTVTTPTEAGEHVLVAEVWDGSERICANRISVVLE